MPAKTNAATAALRNPATAAVVIRPVRPSVENRLSICFLLRRCHGGAMFKVRRQPTVTRPRDACLGAHKKLDQPIPGFRQRLRKLWATGTKDSQGDPMYPIGRYKPLLQAQRSGLAS